MPMVSSVVLTQFISNTDASVDQDELTHEQTLTLTPTPASIDDFSTEDERK